MHHPSEAEHGNERTQEQPVNFFELWFGPLFHTIKREIDTALIEQQKARLEAIANNRQVTLEQRGDAKIKLIPIERELLRRRDPNARAIFDEWNKIQTKKNKEYSAWEKLIADTEGAEALHQRIRSHNVPETYTPAELDTFVNAMQVQADAGIIHPEMMEYARGVREAGGFSNYHREATKQNLLSFKEEILRSDEANTPEAQKAIAEIDNQSATEGWENNTGG